MKLSLTYPNQRGWILELKYLVKIYFGIDLFWLSETRDCLEKSTLHSSHLTNYFWVKVHFQIRYTVLSVLPIHFYLCEALSKKSTIHFGWFWSFFPTSWFVGESRRTATSISSIVFSITGIFKTLPNNYMELFAI